MTNLTGKTKLFMKKNGATILSVAGGAGVVATSVMAVKATPKALMLLSEATEEKGEQLTKTEMLKVAGPSYIPAAIIGAATIACIVGSNALNKKEQAAMAGAYMLLDNSYKEYKKKVKELYSEDGENYVEEEIAKDKLKETEIEVQPDEQLFYDEYSKRFFKSNNARVQFAEYQLNRDLAMRDFAYLNEFYEYLGIEKFDDYSLGWSIGSCMDMYWQNWLDFSHSKQTLEDGTEYTIIYMLCEPIAGFENY